MLIVLFSRRHELAHSLSPNFVPSLGTFHASTLVDLLAEANSLKREALKSRQDLQEALLKERQAEKEASARAAEDAHREKLRLEKVAHDEKLRVEAAEIVEKKRLEQLQEAQQQTTRDFMLSLMEKVLSVLPAPTGSGK